MSNILLRNYAKAFYIT